MLRSVSAGLFKSAATGTVARTAFKATTATTKIDVSLSSSAAVLANALFNCKPHFARQFNTSSLLSNSGKQFPEEKLFVESLGPLKHFEFDVHNPDHSFLEKSPNNPNEPVILLPNLFSNKNAYNVEANEIAKTLETKVYAVNLRNQYSNGSSSNDIEFAKPFDLDSLVSDLVQFCQQNNFEKILLIGDGLGGRIGLLASLLKQKEIDIAKLVVVENLPGDLPQPAIDTLNNWTEALQYLVNDSAIKKGDKELREKAYEVLGEKFGIEDSQTKKFLLNNVTNQSVNLQKTGQYQFLEPKVPLNYIKEEFLPEYFKWPAETVSGLTSESPVLFLLGRHSPFAGSKDIYKSIEAKNKIAKQFPNFEIKTFNSNNFVINNQSSHVTNAICQFLITERNPEYDRLRQQDQYED